MKCSSYIQSYSYNYSEVGKLLQESFNKFEELGKVNKYFIEGAAEASFLMAIATITEIDNALNN